MVRGDFGFSSGHGNPRQTGPQVGAFAEGGQGLATLRLESSPQDLRVSKD
jgi:hypothetical protein